MRKIIRNLLNRQGYDIIKKPYTGGKYPNLSESKTNYYCETPIGNYYLPIIGLEKDAVTNTMVRGKYFEPEIIEVARQYILEGTSVLDIGANFGQMSIEFSKLVGSSGKVYAFEAQEMVFKYLQKNIIANKCKDNVRWFNKAVWNKNNKIVSFKSTDMDCAAPYSGNYITEYGITPVRTITIDSLNIQDHISFIKVDIQGSDLFAMEGARETILKHKPTIIFEFEEQVQDNFKTSFNDYVEFVDSMGYKFVKTISLINYLIEPKKK